MKENLKKAGKILLGIMTMLIVSALSIVITENLLVGVLTLNVYMYIDLKWNA